MRLQSERSAENSSKQKRMTLDLNVARTSWNSPRSANRGSFTPITGSGFTGVPPNLSRRTPSLSVNENDPGFAAFIASLPNSPLDSANDMANRRRSNILGTSRTPPLSVERVGSPGRISPAFVEMESMKRELAAVKAELEETKHELLETIEAREASQICVKSLRDYISQLDLDGHSLPPSATSIPKGENKPLKSSGWNLNLLWGSANQQSVNTTVMKQRAASITSTRSIISEDQNALAQPVPIRSKFGSLFARTSIGSTNARSLSGEFNHDEPILNGSDVSSIAETSPPNSPSTADKNPSVYIHRAVEEDAPVPGDQDHQDHVKIPSA